MKIKNNLSIALYGVVATCLLFSCTQPEPLDQNNAYSVSASSLVGNYSLAKDQVLLQWVCLSTDVSYFEIHRYFGVDANGNKIDEDVFTVGSNFTTYTDKLGLFRGPYHYYVVPCKISSVSVLKGDPSNEIVLNSGKGLHFTINDGSIFAIDTNCTLNFKQDTLIVQSVRFSQMLDTVYKDSTRKSILNIKVNFANSVSNQIYGTSINSFPWVLLKGSGVKSVCAEVTYLDSYIRDTLRFDLSIAPYKVKTRFENKKAFMALNEITKTYDRVGSSDATITQYETSDLWTTNYELYFNRPNVFFSVQISSDSSLDTTFEYYLLIADSTSVFRNNIIETKHAIGSLTGRGKHHNENFIYQYCFSPDSGAKGLNNLEYLFSTYKIDTVPVSKWPSTKIDLGSPNNNYERIKYLLPSEQSYNNKQMVLVLHFKGRYFKDDRYIFSNINFLPSSGVNKKISVDKGYMDFYPPSALLISTYDSRYINNGDTIRKPFDIVLGPEASINDKGYARITQLKLIISKATPELVTRWKNKPLQSAPVSIDELLSNFHIINNFSVSAPQKSLDNVKWSGIDPSQWQSGNYFIGIITKDEYGNEGFAPITIPPESPNQTNPWLVSIQNGK